VVAADHGNNGNYNNAGAVFYILYLQSLAMRGWIEEAWERSLIPCSDIGTRIAISSLPFFSYLASFVCVCFAMICCDMICCDVL
jgi:hypothetical protein